MSDATTTFPCLMCGKDCTTGAFCGEACERGDEELAPLLDEAMRRFASAFGGESARGLRAPTVEDMMREAMLESACWEAFREAKATGVWH